MLGDSAVGKTSIIMRYGGKGFDEQHLATVGIDHVNKKYFSQKNNREITIKMWDTAG